MKIKEKIIDSHVHLDNWFDPEGVDYMTALDRVQEHTGIEGLCIAALGNPKIGGPDINLMAAIYKQHNPTAYAYGSLVFPEYPAKPEFSAGLDPLSQYRALMEMGFDGIKFLYAPDIEKMVGLPINHPVFEPMFAQMESDGTPILWHVADPPADWYGDEFRECRYDQSHPAFEEMMEQVFQVMEKHPKLKVTFAHFLFLEEAPERLEKVFADYEDVWVDLAPGTMFMEFKKDREFFRAFLEKHADRMVYGSDSFVPGNPFSEKLIGDVYRWIATDEFARVWGVEMDGLAVGEDARRKILRDNFLKRNPAPRKMDQQAMKAYWQQVSHMIVNEGNKEPLAEHFNA